MRRVQSKYNVDEDCNSIQNKTFRNKTMKLQSAVHSFTGIKGSSEGTSGLREKMPLK